MAKTTKTTTTKKVVTSPVTTSQSDSTVTSQNEADNMAARELEELKRQNQELADRFNKLMNMFEALSSKNEEAVKAEDNSNAGIEIMDEIEDKFNPDYTPDDINPNKQIMIISLCYGTLNLSDGKNTITFKEYGEARPILYSKLMDMVNENLGFAKQGKFYIVDRDAVYHLGLSDSYRELIPDKVINNITTYSLNAIEKIINVINDSQKDVIVKLLSDRVYRNENLDANKINFISKLVGVDIYKKVDEMEKFAKK